MKKNFIMAKAIALMLVLAYGIVLIQSCKKGNRTVDSNPPVIQSFTPGSAAKDSIITITGINFSTTPAANTVTINDIAVTVLTATATALTVKVPVHAGDGKISLRVGAATTLSANDFKYIFSAGTLAGGNYGFGDGSDTTAKFASAFGVTTDGAGNIFVADGGNNRIRKITPGGVVSTVAGDGSFGNRNGAAGQAQFNYPRGVAVDATGNIYVADAGNNLIRKITPGGIVSTVAGDGTDGYRDGQDTTAQFDFPVELVLDADGNIYVTDGNNSRVRKITPAGLVSTLGNQMGGFPEGIAIDAARNLYIADVANHKIYKMTQAGALSTIAGTGARGHVNGPGATAQFSNPEGIAIDGAGNLYVGDLGNSAVRKITPAGVVSTLAGGTFGYADLPGTKAKFNQPSGIKVDALGNIYLADVGNSRIRKIQ